MKIRKSLAGVAALSLAASGVAVFAAPAANAYSGSQRIDCRLYFSDAGTGSSASNWTETIGLTQTPANPAPGQTVTVTVTSTGGGVTGPVPVAANSLRLAVGLVGTGQAPATVSLQSSAVGVGSYPASAIGAYTALGPWAASGTYVASGNGAASLALGQIKFDAIATDATNNVDTYCSDSNGVDIDHKAAPVTSPDVVQAFEVDARTVTVASTTQQSIANYGRPGQNVTLTLNNAWTAGTVKIELCPTGSTSGCDSVDAAAAFAGTAPYQVTAALPSGLTTGLRDIVVTDSDTTHFKTAAYNVLGTRTLSLAPANGGPGTTVAITGSNWDTGQAIALTGSKTVSSLATPTSDTGVGTGSGTGAASGSIQITDTATDSIVAAQASGSATAAFAVNADTCIAQVGSGTPTLCETKQNITATVNPGALSQTAYANSGGWNTASLSGGGTVLPAANYFNVPVTCARAAGPCGAAPNVATGMKAGVIRASFSAGAVVAAFPVIPGVNYQAGDVITIAAGATGIGSTAITFTLASANGYTSTSIAFGAVNTSATSQVINRQLNPIIVSDARGGSIGWSLTAAMPALSETGGGSIANSNMVLSNLQCGAWASGSATGNTKPAGNQPFSAPVTLCSKNTTADSAGGTSGGEYVITGALGLTIPAFQKTGAYTSTITVTLA